ncbi:MAG: glycerophosphoryl diester phosphodiesterase [Alphaproteobacteria bacterium]|nr:glycerophosphoryl diester phosphodiesterase [Alphaproteobacteria bacterium]
MRISPLPWLEPVIAHRGASGVAPENTLAAIRRAGELGARWVEVDLRRTASGPFVLMHDATLDRTTNGTGLVSETPCEAIAGLDAGGWFGSDFAGEPVPTLNAFMALCGELGLVANIEIKAEADADAVGYAAAKALLEGWPGTLPPPLISSDSPTLLRAVAKIAPDFPRGLIVTQVPSEAVLNERAWGCVSVHASDTFLTRAKTALLVASGYAVLVYTVNTPARARTLFGWGVDAIFTDHPEPARWQNG